MNVLFHKMRFRTLMIGLFILVLLLLPFALSGALPNASLTGNLGNAIPFIEYGEYTAIYDEEGNLIELSVEREIGNEAHRKGIRECVESWEFPEHPEGDTITGEIKCK